MERAFEVNIQSAEISADVSESESAEGRGGDSVPDTVLDLPEAQVKKEVALASSETTVLGKRTHQEHSSSVVLSVAPGMLPIGEHLVWEKSVKVALKKKMEYMSHHFPGEFVRYTDHVHETKRSKTTESAHERERIRGCGVLCKCCLRTSHLLVDFDNQLFALDRGVANQFVHGQECMYYGRKRTFREADLMRQREAQRTIDKEIRKTDEHNRKKRIEELEESLKGFSAKAYSMSELKAEVQYWSEHKANFLKCFSTWEIDRSTCRGSMVSMLTDMVNNLAQVYFIFNVPVKHFVFDKAIKGIKDENTDDMIQHWVNEVTTILTNAIILPLKDVLNREIELSFLSQLQEESRDDDDGSVWSITIVDSEDSDVESFSFKEDDHTESAGAADAQHEEKSVKEFAIGIF